MPMLRGARVAGVAHLYLLVSHYHMPLRAEADFAGENGASAQPKGHRLRAAKSMQSITRAK